jgi:PAS domain S-box-containing protein
VFDPPKGQAPPSTTQSTVTVHPETGLPAGGNAHERFQLAGRATQSLLWDWEVETGTVVWAGTTLPYFGVSPDRLGELPEDPHDLWSARVHPDDLVATETTCRAAVASGAESWEHEYRFRRADGGYAHIQERAFIARDEAGRAIRIIGSMEDISARKSSEAATTRLAAIVGTSADAIIGKTLDGLVTSWNPAAEGLFGYTEREMLGQSIFVLIPEELHGEERDLLARIRRGERVDFADTERIRKDGTRIYIALTVSPVFNAAGEVTGASSIKRDITGRKRAEEELARREERYRALVTATTSIVWTADPEGRFDAAQRSWQAYTGQRLSEQEGHGWLQAVHPDDREAVSASWFQARDRRAIWEHRTARLWSQAHRAYRHFVSRAVPVLGPDGRVREWIGTVTDTEDRWMAEERLRRAERMESVGRLAGGVAHEANNQMTVILGAAEFLARAITDEAARMDVEHIRRAARRTASITQQLLAFSRRQVLQPQLVDLNAVVRALEPILQRALGEVSQIRLRLSGDLGQVRADPGQLDQVLLNLALNARDAMPNGGTLTIETVNVVVDERYAAGKTVEAVAPGAYVALIVSDTGAGMDRETLSHIFEPFFTTKGVGEGTGLGLATVYGIVSQSGGFVSAYSEPGQGSSFRIYLPFAGTRGEPERPAAATVLGGGNETILVAEDEPAVRAIIARALREYGYTVIEARDGLQALDLAQSLVASPDLLIADVVMPGVGGNALAKSLQVRWPDIPVLFTSGYTGDDAVQRGLLDEGTEFMQKPLEPEVVAMRVRQILDTRTNGVPH